jgi:hypothetical protein
MTGILKQIISENYMCRKCGYKLSRGVGQAGVLIVNCFNCGLQEGLCHQSKVKIVEKG